VSEFAGGGGPIIPGTLFPFAFITIACGAISGFHALISSGTTPKMIDKESDIRPIGYGAMLMEGLVGVMALIAATAMHPGDYYAINVPLAAQEQLDLPAVVNLPELERQVGEQVAGRTGGGVSLAVGMAQIFTALPGMRGLIAYWYHFAIMFEALFILTTIDAGTRVGRFLVQEFLGRAYAPFARQGWMPGAIIATALVVGGWSFFIYTGEINTIWPMFGIANQLLACVALTVGTTIIISMGKQKYAWVTAAPLAFLATNTLYAGFLSVRDNFYPMTRHLDPKISFTGWVQTSGTVVMMACVFVIIGAAVGRWVVLLSGRRPQVLSGPAS
jgi:carbon starvation protein